MTQENSISGWIAGAKVSDPAALNALWGLYYPKLVLLARGRLNDHTRRVSDEEDVAISVFESFFRAAEKNRFPNLADRDQLWQLLLRMTVRKSIDHHRRFGGRRFVSGESAFNDAQGELHGIAEVNGDEPSPELVVAIVDATNNLMNLLEDEQLRQIAAAKLEGYENGEIAKNLDCSVSTVERRLRLVRKKWSAYTPS